MHLSVARCFVFLLLATTTAALIVYVFGYMPFWPVEYQHWLAIPYNDGLTSGLVSSGFILTTSVLVFLFNPRWLPIAVAALLAAIWLWMEVRPMGDSGHWLAHAASKDLWLSEFLANYFFHLTYQLGIEFQYVAPVFGALLVLSWFSLKPVLFEPADDGVWWLVLTFSLTSSVVMALYTRNFIENTLLSVPVLLFHLRCAPLRTYRTAPVAPVRSCIACFGNFDTWSEYVHVACFFIVGLNISGCSPNPHSH